MTPNEYQELAMRTARSNAPQYDRYANWALGLCGEAGEVSEHIKKFLFHKKLLDVDAIVKELGDVLWYTAVLANDLGYSLENVMDVNIAKLQERYPDGFPK